MDAEASAAGRSDKQGYIDRNVEQTTNKKGNLALQFRAGSSLSKVWPKGINVTCHGCHNELVLPTAQVPKTTGFLVCCDNKDCKPKSGKQSAKAWCEVCLKKIGCASDWQNGWALTNDDSPHESEQKEDWCCPHCCTPAGLPCPAPCGCTSTSTKKQRTDTQGAAGNPNHGLPLQSAASRLSDKQAQNLAAEQQYASGHFNVRRLSIDALTLSAWDAKRCKVKDSQVSAGVWHNLPVVVSRTREGQLLCCSPTDSTTCQPRGQCVHIHLVQKYALFEAVPFAPADGVSAQDADVAAAMEDSCDSSSDEDGEAPAPAPGHPATMVLLHQGATADVLKAADAHIDDRQLFQGLLFFVSAGRTNTDTSFNWVVVKDGKWRCSAREHTNKSHLAPCRCMDAVMDALGFTQEDLCDLAAIGSLCGERADQEQLVGNAAPPISYLRRPMEQHHGNGPRIYKHCLPEAMELLLHAHAPEVLEEIDNPGTTVERVVDLLRQLANSQVCTVHGEPHELRWTAAQVTDGDNPLQNVTVYWTVCKHSRSRRPTSGTEQQQQGACPPAATEQQPDSSVPCYFHYDGGGHDLFNLNNTELLSHRFLLRILLTFRHHGSSFNAVREVLIAMHSTLPPDAQQKVMSLPTLIRAFFGWLELLDGLPGFKCPVCKEHPEVLVVDGTGYKVFDKHTQDLLSFGHPTHEEDESQGARSRTSERKLVTNGSARKLLVRYSQARATAKCTPLTAEELEQLMSWLQGIEPDEHGAGGRRAAGPRCVADLLRIVPAVQSLHVDGCWQAAPCLAGVLYHLGYSHSSDTAMIQSLAAYDAIQYLQQAGWERLPEVAPILAQDARVLLHLYEGCRDLAQQHPGLLGVATTVIGLVAQQWHTFIGSASPEQSKSCMLDGLPEGHPAHARVALQQLLSEYSTDWSVKHTRPQYMQHEDATGRSKDASVYRKCDNTKPLVGTGQRKFSPGICKWSCIHGICQGFHIFKEPESPSDIFTLLLTRIPRDKLPTILFYDNGCKLYEYLLNREPWILRNLRIFVDTFHYGTSCVVPIHKCPAVFNGKEHSVACLFNSQNEEQGNAFVALHKRSARTMSLDRARRLLSAMMQLWNGSKISAMQGQDGNVLSQWLDQYAAAQRCLRSGHLQ